MVSNPTAWARSLIVVGFFCLALTVGARLEERWRPAGYPRHPVSAYDRIAVGIAVGMLVISVLLVRYVAPPV